jgi:hypothetical protein
MRLPRAAAALCALALLEGGCASYDLVKLPQRKADLYPLAEENRDIWVAVDAITQPRRARRFFGADLADHGIHPVEIVVTNNGRERIRVGPDDVFMVRGGSVIDPIPLDLVAEVVKDRLKIVTDGTSKRIERFLDDLSFRETVLAPGQSYHGVMFFDTAEEESGRPGRFFRISYAYPEPSFYITAAVTGLERKQRFGFGPFGVHR